MLLKNSNNILHANRVDKMPSSAESDRVTPCLPMSHKKDHMRIHAWFDILNWNGGRTLRLIRVTNKMFYVAYKMFC